MHDVIVVGGGIAGLTAAWKLKQRGRDVLVLEERERAGGNIRTLAHDGYRLETGPHSFMGSSDSIWRLIGETGMEDDVEKAGEAAGNRYIYRDGSLYPLPMSVASFLKTPLLSTRAKVRLCLEPFIRNGAAENETAWDFFSRRFGREAATFIMSPFVSGIYAGDVRQLGARAAFDKFWTFERESGSMIIGAVKYMRRKRKRLAREGIRPRKGLFSFRGGLGRITQKLSAELHGSLLTGARVDSVTGGEGEYIVRAGGGEWKAASIVLSVPPHRVADITGDLIPGLGETLRGIPMAPVLLTHWTPSENDARLPAGFGFLVPRLYQERVLGTIFTSQLFSGRSPDGIPLLASFYGGVLDPGAADLDDAELEELLHREHRRILGDRIGRPRLLETFRYPKAIPQLLPDHIEKITRVHRILEGTPGIFLAGNYLTGVGMDHAVASGYRAAEVCGDYMSTITVGEKT